MNLFEKEEQTAPQRLQIEMEQALTAFMKDDVGLHLFEVPTGTGKTEVATNVMAKMLRGWMEKGTPMRRIFFITPQNKQLPIDRLLSKLGVTAEHSILEIGTGWGGFALRAVDSTGCKVTTTTISDEQLHEASLRLQAAGLSDSVDLKDADWRDLTGQFDRVASIEMIEAVDWRDYDRYFSTIEQCMKPDGLAAIQAICVPDRRYERTKNTEDFIRRFVFPGGFLPSISAISSSVARSTSMQIVDVEDLSAHYAETLRRWRETFDERLDEVAALGLDERFCRLWRFYLAYCEAGFAERHCTVNQIVFAGRHWRPDGLGLRLS